MALTKVTDKQVTFKHGGTGSQVRGLGDKLRESVSVKDFGAVGDGITDDTAPIQAAINATSAGGSLLIPIGEFLISDTLTFPSVTTVIGHGVGSVLKVATSMTIGQDVLHIHPTSTALLAENYLFKNFAIDVESGTPAGYAIHIDSDTVNIANLTIDGLTIHKTGNTSIRADGANSASILTIQNSKIANGISLATAGDTIRIINNQISGDKHNLDLDFYTGALLLIMTGNNCVSKYGVHIGSPALFSIIADNEFETFASFVGSNGAMLDIDGSVSDDVYDFVISRNSFSIVNGISANPIRVNYATRTIIKDNRLFNGITGLPNTENIVITTNATDTYIGPNQWDNGGNLYDRVSDSGTNTVISTNFYGSTVLKGSLGIGTVGAPAAAVEVQASGQALLAQTGSTSAAVVLAELKNGADQSAMKVYADRRTVFGGSFAAGTLGAAAGNYTLADTDISVTFYTLGATATLTLPSAASHPSRQVYVRTQSNQAVISASNNITDLASGAVTNSILSATAGKWALLISGGGYWNIVASN